MKVYSTSHKGRLTLSLQGELDQHEAGASVAVIEGLLEEYLPRECVLDLSGLTFMDSSGIALILRLYRRMALDGGVLRVENAAAQPLRVLDASGIERRLQISLTKEAGV